ncbi:MAG TPA: thymidylate kinase [Mollicutes bacterium]|nr:thymidylate kinase [Mollicutes bacterium]
MRGKIILIEGTDCSGKQTQTEALVRRLSADGIRVEKMSFPMYETPTGKIVGGPYLGKEHISECWFKEGANNVDPKVASLYYAADRKYNISKIEKLLDDGVTIILDRYTPSNMAHHGGKISNKEERLAFYKWIDTLEYKLLELPQPDYAYLLYMPYEAGQQLRNSRIKTEKLDEHEKSEANLRNAEAAYLEIAEIYNFEVINCVKDNEIRTIEDINNELYDNLISKLDMQNKKTH